MKKITLTSTLLAMFTTPAIADIHITLGSGGLKATDSDNNIEFKMGGRLQFDYNNVIVDPVPGEQFTSVDDMDVRRARIFAAGSMDDWAFKAQFNITPNDDSGKPEDLYIRYKGFGKLATVTVGKQKEAFGLELLTSSKDITMLERSAITEAFVQGRGLGVNVGGDWGHGFYTVGLFESDDESKTSMQDPTLNARVVYAPIKADNKLVHLGLGYSHRAKDLNVSNIELATSLGAFHAQAEYFLGDQADEDMDGYYVQAAYVLTGEHRGYKKGALKRIKPKSKYGAWELAARFESGFGKYSDFGLSEKTVLEDGTTKAGLANLEDGKAWTVGVNWYANNNVRFGLNYGMAKVDASAFEGQNLRFRTQLVW